MNEYPSDSPQPTPPQQQGVRAALPRSAPYVTYFIIGITVFFYVLQLVSEYIFGQDILIL